MRWHLCGSNLYFLGHGGKLVWHVLEEEQKRVHLCPRILETLIVRRQLRLHLTNTLAPHLTLCTHGQPRLLQLTRASPCPMASLLRNGPGLVLLTMVLLHLLCTLTLCHWRTAIHPPTCLELCLQIRHSACQPFCLSRHAKVQM